MTVAPQAPTSADRFRSHRLRVEQVRREAEGVVALTLADPAGAELPVWTAGAHVDLVLPSGLVRQYSLCGDPADRSTFTVAVLRESGGRGGSVEIHDSALVGRELDVRGPRNHFELRPAPSYLFLAGGIGVTPLLTMATAVSAAGVPWTLHYGGRSRRHMAFATRLGAIGGERVHLIPQDELGLPDLGGIVAAAPGDAAVYACGPEGMLRAVERACAEATPPRQLRVERFASGRSTAPVRDEGGAGEFEVALRRTGVAVRVPADRSVLDAVRDVVPDVPSSCEEGFCGSCEVPVLEGTPDHRDQILTPEEQEESATMMICVSRCRGPRLVLDL